MKKITASLILLISAIGYGQERKDEPNPILTGLRFFVSLQMLEQVV